MLSIKREGLSSCLFIKLHSHFMEAERTPMTDLIEMLAILVPLEQTTPPSGCPSAPYYACRGSDQLTIKQTTLSIRKYCIANQTLYLPYSIFWVFPLRVKEKSIDCRTHTEYAMEDNS